MKKEVMVLAGQATPEQIASWKKSYGDVFAISVDGKVCYLRKPGRKEMSYAASIGMTDPMGVSEAIMNTCWLGGCEEIKTQDDLFLSAVSQIDKVVETKKAELVKL